MCEGILHVHNMPISNFQISRITFMLSHPTCRHPHNMLKKNQRAFRTLGMPEDLQKCRQRRHCHPKTREMRNETSLKLGLVSSRFVPPLNNGCKVLLCYPNHFGISLFLAPKTTCAGLVVGGVCAAPLTYALAPHA